MEEIKVSDYIADFLANKKVTHVFEMVGGMITHMLDSINQRGLIKIVSCHHEQAAAFAAEGMGRTTGVPGVAMATSGPGATNLITGIASCYFDSVPSVFITGQVNTNEMKGNRKIRQLGFQETDIVRIAKPITKASWQILSAKDVPKMMEKAFRLAVDGRPGPVLLDIPMNIQRATITVPTTKNNEMIKISKDNFDKGQAKKLFTLLGKAQRPLILVGGGLKSSRTVTEFREFVRVTKVPVVYSLMAVDALPYGHPQHIGLIGSYGNRWANMALGQADFVLVLGSRLDVKQTGADTKSFKAGRTFYHVDCDASEINNRVTGCHSVVADLRTFFSVALEATEEYTFKERSGWLAKLNTLKKRYPDTAEQNVSGINPNALMHKISRVSQQASTYVVDVGQHQMWAAQSMEVNKNQNFLTSGGLGSMGFSLPAAVGVAFASAKPVLLIAGDGCFQCNIQELETVAHHSLPIKMVVINNSCLGMVRQFQADYFDKNYQSTVLGYSTPNFEKIGNAYGIPSKTIDANKQIKSALDWLWQDPKKPALLQIMIDQSVNAYPKMAFGNPITKMEPLKD